MSTREKTRITTQKELVYQLQEGLERSNGQSANSAARRGTFIKSILRFQSRLAIVNLREM